MTFIFSRNKNNILFYCITVYLHICSYASIQCLNAKSDDVLCMIWDSTIVDNSLVVFQRIAIAT